MADITKIVLTGGPCGGKTKALKFLSDKLKEYEVSVLTVEEQATALMSSGKSSENMGSYAFHALLFKNQLEAEQKAEALASGKTLIICDRGLLDSRAYVTEDEFSSYAGLYGFTEESIRNRYDAVFHLVTAANGAEEHYHFDNPARSESIEKARGLDENLLALWTGTQHLRVLDNKTDFQDKLDRLLKEVLAVLGIPKPLEIERKLLIEYPDLKLLNNMKLCRRIPITQAYMCTPEENIFRVRKRGEGKDALYIKTKKYKISDLKRIEIEKYISKEEYSEYLNRKDCVQGIISKDRYCLVYNSTYFELDVYPFWNDRATIEVELLSENEKFELPGFLTLIRDVSFEKEYRNKQLAVTYADFFNKLKQNGDI
jgi:CYTH domain-containing protein/thymidylate kinase